MRKKLLSLVSALLISSASMNAQTTWNFSDFADNAGYTSNTVVNNLGFIPGPSTSTNLMGQVEANGATIDGIAFTKRLKLNGGSFTSGTTDFGQVPPQRAMYLKVNGASVIKLWYKNGGGGNRTVYVSNGTTVIASFLYTDSTVGQVATVNYTGGAANLYISGDQAINFYQLSATNVGTTLPTLATSNVNTTSANVFASGNQVFVNNLKAATQINVYTSTGALVKSVNAKADTNFDLKSGFYIVNLKSENGTTSKKVIIK